MQKRQVEKQVRELLTSSKFTFGHKCQRCKEIRQALSEEEFKKLSSEIQLNINLYGNLTEKLSAFIPEDPA